MKKTLIFFLLILPMIFTPAHAVTPGEVLVGGRLQDVMMTGVFFGQRNLSDFRGKPLLINVWASWCGPCRDEMGSLQRLAKQLEGRVVVIGVSTDDDQRAAQNFLKREKITFSNFIDRNLILENMLGADKLPLTLLVDPGGRVIRKISGARVWDSNESVSSITTLLKVKN